MDLTEKNGQPSMEEILASIRRIIAEEPQGHNPVIDLNARSAAARTDMELEEGSDFELPSMFRPSLQPATEKPTPLFGRLTDAIRGASASVNGHSEAKAVRQNDHLMAPTDHGRLNGHASDDTVRTHPSLSSLKLSRIEPIAVERELHKPQMAPLISPVMPTAVSGSHTNGHAAHPEVTGTLAAPVYGAAAAPPSIEEQLPRQMAAFKDTRFCKMVAPDAPVSPSAVAADLTLPSAFDLVAGAHMQPDPFKPMTTLPESHFSAPEPLPAFKPPVIETPYLPVVEFVPPAHELPPPVYPQMGSAMPVMPTVFPEPSVPAKSESFAQGGIEDTTADLLRPMLRQWLADNMPRMVEKALHIEVAESVKTVKKFTGH